MLIKPSTEAPPTFEKLFSPLAVGPVEFRNRIVNPAHTMLLGERDGSIGERYRSYLVERAAGGAAIVGLESAPVDSASLSFPQQIRLWDPSIYPSLERAARAVHDRGALLSVMLWHGGRNVPHLTGNVPASASAIPSLQTGDTPRVLRASEIPAIVGAYALAARRCVEAGVKVLEVQTASDYLLGAFLSSRLNRRCDDYGGSLEKRARLALEVLRGIRDVVGRSVALGIRTSAAHHLPLDPDGYDESESLPIVSHLAASGLIDYVSVMTGSNGVMSKTIPPMSAPRSMAVDVARRFKQALTIPVFVAGRIKTPDEAEGILARGDADAVVLARALIADPAWPNKAKCGAVSKIRPCLSCNQACLGFANRMMPAGCVVNAEAGFEFQPQWSAHRAHPPRRIAVVGGGPAGLEASRRLAAEGNSVDLYDAAASLGGAYRLAALAPHRGELLPMLDWWEQELAVLGVNVHLNHRISVNAPPEADEVVWATGASPAWTALWRNRPQCIDGIPGAQAHPHGREVLAGAASASGHVAVIDEEGGWPLVSLVDSLLATRDVTQVTLVTSAPVAGGLDLFMTAEAPEVIERLQRERVVTHAMTFAGRVDDRYIETTSGQRIGPFDSIVLSMGVQSNVVPDGAVAIGDCLAPRGIWAAVQEGARVPSLIDGGRKAQ